MNIECSKPYHESCQLLITNKKKQLAPSPEVLISTKAKDKSKKEWIVLEIPYQLQPQPSNDSKNYCVIEKTEERQAKVI